MLQDWHQDYSSNNIDFASVASGADESVVVIDNSGTFSNSILKWSKLKITIMWEPEDHLVIQPRVLATALLKLDEDVSATAVALDSEEVIRELRRDGKLVRGPWLMTTPVKTTEGFTPAYAHILKPITLRNFTMDREEDLVAAYTSVSTTAFGATSQVLRHFSQGFVRVIK